jgi:hypothetical protein
LYTPYVLVCALRFLMIFLLLIIFFKKKKNYIVFRIFGKDCLIAIVDCVI